MSVCTIVVAAGSGQRFGGPKQFAPLNPNQRVLDRSLATAMEVSDSVICVLPDGTPRNDAGLEGETFKSIVVVEGGETRSESVRNALATVPDDAHVIVVHDAVRPMATQD